MKNESSLWQKDKLIRQKKLSQEPGNSTLSLYALQVQRISYA